MNYRFDFYRRELLQKLKTKGESIALDYPDIVSTPNPITLPIPPIKPPHSLYQ